MGMNCDCTCEKCQKGSHCGRKGCSSPCGCAEPVFHIEALSDDPTVLKFNVNGKTVWYDFESAIKAGETCTTLLVDSVARTLNYLAECAEYSISAKELGSILHLADLADVDENTVGDNALLVYQKEADCGEGCEGISGDGWKGLNPIDAGKTSLSYMIGSDADGAIGSLMPPTNTNQYYQLGWNAQNKLSYSQPPVVGSIPVDGSGYSYRLYLDPSTKQIVVVKHKEN